MEENIAATFLIMLSIALIIMGICNIVMTGSYSIAERTEEAIALAMIYLLVIWMNTRRHKILAGISVMGIGMIIFLNGFVQGYTLNWQWGYIIIAAFVVMEFIVAMKQSGELLEEESQCNTEIITIIFTLDDKEE